MHFSDFVLDDYRDGLFWFEPFDLLRKLVLTALPRMIGSDFRGSASQRLLMGCLSLVFLALQVHWQPYKHAWSNVLKIGVEANIFLLVAIASWMRSDQSIYFDRSSQYFFAGAFWVFTGAVVVLSCCDILLRCCKHCRRNSAEHRAEVLRAGGTSPGIVHTTKTPLLVADMTSSSLPRPQRDSQHGGFTVSQHGGSIAAAT
eukprot:COSAG01_NODE_3820_length_5664_cov_3.383827_4_plen_201_part_00